MRLRWQSVVVWSFCNEFECIQNDANYSADAFRAAALSVDPTRALTANHYGDEGLSARLDVQVVIPPSIELARVSYPPTSRGHAAVRTL